MDTDDPVSKLRTLSITELKILQMKCQGMDYEDIGLELGYAISTIQVYASTMHQKLGIEKKLHSSKRFEILKTVYCPELHRLEDAPVKPDDPDPQPPHEIMVLVGQEIKEEREKRLALRKPTEIIDIQPRPTPQTPPPQPPIREPWWLYLIIALLSLAVLYLLGKDLFPTLISQWARSSTPVTAIVSTNAQPATIIPAIESTALSGPIVLWETHFEDGKFPDDWNVETKSVKPAIKNKYFIVPEEFRFTVGDGSWKDVSATIDFVDKACGAGIGLRSELVLGGCLYEGNIWANDTQSLLPDGTFSWSGKDEFTFKVIGDTYYYFGNDLVYPGNMSGNVWFRIPGGTKVRKIKVVQLP